MKVSLSTGGERDYLELTAESLEEASSLVAAERSQFVRGPKRMHLVHDAATIKIRVWVGEQAKPLTKEEQAAIAAEHDSVT